MSTAIVVGGGLAGIAAATALAQRGVRVQLLEQRRRLGGRASSFVDATTGEELDNCQHVVLGCCTNYLNLLDELGVGDCLRWTREQYWVERGGRTTVLKPDRMPAPYHMSRSFACASFLSLADRVIVARGLLGLMALSPVQLTGRTFSSVLGELGQTETAIRRFWSPVVVSACNLSVDRVDAALAAKVFVEGSLANPNAADIGVPTLPLSRLFDAVGGILQRAGGSIAYGMNCTYIAADHVVANGEILAADCVVCALPFERASAVCVKRDGTPDPRLVSLVADEHSPILGVHLWFDRPWFELPHAVLVECDTQWLFRKDDAGARVHAVVSGADAWMSLTEEEVVARVIADIRACFPASSPCKVLRARAVKERRATFRATPNFDGQRPTPGATTDDLCRLAGDYTQTGWPATMEGAVRSGWLAVDKPLADELRAGLVFSFAQEVLGTRSSI